MAGTELVPSALAYLLQSGEFLQGCLRETFFSSLDIDLERTVVADRWRQNALSNRLQGPWEVFSECLEVQDYCGEFDPVLLSVLVGRRQARSPGSRRLGLEPRKKSLFARVRFSKSGGVCGYDSG